MPKLTKNGNGVKGCAVCPVLKKRVLKKILASTSVNAHADNGDGDVVVAKRKDATSNTNEPQEEEEEEVDEIMKARQSLFDSAKTQSYYERPSSSSSPLVQESHTTSLDFSQGRDAEIQ